eukprot:CAMPEP_0115043784 /NCGR_PEP_ID=MMETSP0216-20121206/47082_1 /TAXON_ID=223996 /ORGANISM="Protocruzia adherens, Strain Boccale" /LENGTH=868 /DNA_ID=CAMNT_0002426185 /DNA_START=300 /DNA_END=2907 /DNA_ORIENTATION=+
MSQNQYEIDGFADRGEEDGGEYNEEEEKDVLDAESEGGFTHTTSHSTLTNTTAETSGSRKKTKDADKDKGTVSKKPVPGPNTKAGRVLVNIAGTKYEIVKHVSRKVFGWKVTIEEEEDWDLSWLDTAVLPERLSKMKLYQKINHFPGMYSIARKNYLGRNLSRMAKLFPKDFKFFPRTWLLPAEYGDFRAQFNKKKAKTFIVKPEASCQGKGIFLTRTYKDVDPTEHFVAQRYVHKPYLIDDLKFDLRLYVLIAGCDPLRLFLHEEGLARFATESYNGPVGGNLSDVCMHLTNYAINKNSEKFVFNEDKEMDDVGHKRSLQSVWKLMEAQGTDIVKMKKDINKLIIKTFCSIQPHLAHVYKSCQPDDLSNGMCFEILGFDILLDDKAKPWLIEVNHSPSFKVDTPFDRKVKKTVISEALQIMDISAKNRRRHKLAKKNEMQRRVLTGKMQRLSQEERAEKAAKLAEKRTQWENKHLGGYERIYPCEDADDYAPFIHAAGDIWNELTGANKKYRKDDDSKDKVGDRNANKIGPNSAKKLESIYGKSQVRSEVKAKTTNSIKKSETPRNRVIKTPIVDRSVADGASDNLKENTDLNQDPRTAVFTVDTARLTGTERKSSQDESLPNYMKPTKGRSSSAADYQVYQYGYLTANSPGDISESYRTSNIGADSATFDHSGLLGTTPAASTTNSAKPLRFPEKEGTRRIATAGSTSVPRKTFGRYSSTERQQQQARNKKFVSIDESSGPQRNFGMSATSTNFNQAATAASKFNNSQTRFGSNHTTSRTDLKKYREAQNGSPMNSNGAFLSPNLMEFSLAAGLTSNKGKPLRLTQQMLRMHEHKHSHEAIPEDNGSLFAVKQKTSEANKRLRTFQ